MLRRAVSSTLVAAHLGNGASAAVSPDAAGQQRRIIVPRQVVAYGGHLNNAANGGMGDISPDAVMLKANKLTGLTRRSVTAFKEMMLPVAVTEQLAEMGVTTPSPVQQMAIVPALKREHMLIAAGSGTGKTLAYLAPIFANLLEDRDNHKIPTRERRPRVVICCPTKETVDQVADVCRRLGGPLGFKTVGVAPRKRRAKRAKSRAMKRHLADVVVASPHVLAQLIRAKRLFLDDLRTVVLDEADALLGEGHGGHAARLMSMVQKRSLYKHLWPTDAQRLLITSTVTKPVQKHCDVSMPSHRKVVAPGTHEPNPLQRHQFFRCNTPHERSTHLRWLLDQSGNRATPWPVEDDRDDVGPREHEWPPLPTESTADAEPSATPDGPRTSNALVKTSASELPAVSRTAPHNPAGLNESDVTAPATCVWQHLTTQSAPFTGAVRRVVVAPGERVVVFFSSIDRCTALFHLLHNEGYRVAIVHGTLPGDVRERNFKRWASGQCNVLLTTDLLARGIDYRVDRVINFDSPHTPLAYLVRAGRTGRMGRRGVVQTLFGKRDATTVSVVRQFVKGGLALENVSGRQFQAALPTYGQYRNQQRDAIAKRYVKLITTRRIPAHLEKKYLRKDATWRPLFQPEYVAEHGGIAPVRQDKLRDRVMAAAVLRRKQIEANIKGGSAKWGRHGKGPKLQATKGFKVSYDSSGGDPLTGPSTPSSPLQRR